MELKTTAGNDIAHRGAAIRGRTLEHMNDTTCILCERGSDLTPLLTLEYRGASFPICPQHLPVLIHDPSQLVGLISGAEGFQPADHKD